MRDLELDIYKIFFSLNIISYEQEQLLSKSIINIIFKTQDTYRAWQIFTEQAIITDIINKILLDMT